VIDLSLPEEEEFLQLQMLQRHGRLAATLPVVALAIAMGLTLVLWSPNLNGVLLAWFAGAAVAIGAHLAVHLRLSARSVTRPDHRRRLRMYRLSTLVHGLAWGACGLLLEALPEGVLHQALLLSVLTVVASAVVVGAFDLVALGAFGTAATLPAAVHIALHDATSANLLVLTVAVVAAVGAAVSNRREFIDTVRRRRAELLLARKRADSLERVQRAIVLAGVAGWEYDPQTQVMTFDEDVRSATRMGQGGQEPLEQLLAGLEPGSALALEQALTHSVRTGKPLSVEVIHKVSHDPTQPRVVVFSGGAVLEADRVVQLTGTVQDVTALRTREKEAADQARLMQQLVQNTNQGMWFLDNLGLTTDINDAMCRLLGRPRQEVLGRPVFDFFAGADLDILRHQLELRKLGHKEGYEIGIDRPDGTRVECFNNATPLHDTTGRKLGSVGMWTDLTPLKAVMQRAEHAHRELFSLLDAFPGFVTAVDTEGRCTFMNRRMAQRCALDPQAVIGLPMNDLRSAEGLQEAGARAELMDAGQVIVEVSRFQPRDEPGAGPIWLQTTRVAGTPTTQGRRQYYAFGTDITALKETEELLSQRERELRSVLDAFPGLAVMVDADWRYRYANQMASDLFGRPVDQIVGATLDQVLGPARAAQLRAESDSLHAGQRITTEFVVGPDQPLPRGTTFQLVRLAGPPRPDGRRNYFAFGHDITEIRQYETRIEAALSAAEAASRAKSEFLSQISHELRTPLNAILGFAQLLRTDREHPLAPPQQLKVQEMLGGAEHLLGLINGLLDLGRIESGQFQVSVKPVALQGLLQECLALVAPVAERQGITLTLEPCTPQTLTVLADPTRLTQIMVNLLGNAIKYNRPQGRVRMRAQVAPEDGGVQVEVLDTGLGLTEQELSRLFEPFQRLRAEGSGVEGTGIGLALSRRLAQAMSGDITVRSTPGEGSTFTVTIRRSATALVLATEPAREGQTQQEQQAVAATVLYIEDNPVNALVMQAMLTRIPGLEMLHAEDGEPGLALALTRTPQLILTDIQMPGMDGFALLQQLRCHEATRHIPVVAITADATATSLERGRAAGFDGYLTKPVQMDELHAVLRRLLIPARARCGVRSDPASGS